MARFVPAANAPGKTEFSFSFSKPPQRPTGRGRPAPLRKTSTSSQRLLAKLEAEKMKPSLPQLRFQLPDELSASVYSLPSWAAKKQTIPMTNTEVRWQLKQQAQHRRKEWERQKKAAEMRIDPSMWGDDQDLIFEAMVRQWMRVLRKFGHVRTPITWSQEEDDIELFFELIGESEVDPNDPEWGDLWWMKDTKTYPLWIDELVREGKVTLLDGHGRLYVPGPPPSESNQRTHSGGNRGARGSGRRERRHDDEEENRRGREGEGEAPASGCYGSAGAGDDPGDSSGDNSDDESSDPDDFLDDEAEEASEEEEEDEGEAMLPTARRMSTSDLDSSESSEEERSSEEEDTGEMADFVVDDEEELVASEPDNLSDMDAAIEADVIQERPRMRRRLVRKASSHRQSDDDDDDDDDDADIRLPPATAPAIASPPSPPVHAAQLVSTAPDMVEHIPSAPVAAPPSPVRISSGDSSPLPFGRGSSSPAVEPAPARSASPVVSPVTTPPADRLTRCPYGSPHATPGGPNWIPPSAQPGPESSQYWEFASGGGGRTLRFGTQQSARTSQAVSDVDSSVSPLIKSAVKHSPTSSQSTISSTPPSPHQRNTRSDPDASAAETMDVDSPAPSPSQAPSQEEGKVSAKQQKPGKKTKETASGPSDPDIMDVDQSPSDPSPSFAVPQGDERRGSLPKSKRNKNDKGKKREKENNGELEEVVAASTSPSAVQEQDNSVGPVKARETRGKRGKKAHQTDAMNTNLVMSEHVLPAPEEAVPPTTSVKAEKKKAKSHEQAVAGDTKRAASPTASPVPKSFESTSHNEAVEGVEAQPDPASVPAAREKKNKNCKSKEAALELVVQAHGEQSSPKQLSEKKRNRKTRKAREPAPTTSVGDEEPLVPHHDPTNASPNNADHEATPKKPETKTRKEISAEQGLRAQSASYTNRAGGETGKRKRDDESDGGDEDEKENDNKPPTTAQEMAGTQMRGRGSRGCKKRHKGIQQPASQMPQTMSTTAVPPSSSAPAPTHPQPRNVASSVNTSSRSPSISPSSPAPSSSSTSSFRQGHGKNHAKNKKKKLLKKMKRMKLEDNSLSQGSRELGTIFEEVAQTMADTKISPEASLAVTVQDPEGHARAVYTKQIAALPVEQRRATANVLLDLLKADVSTSSHLVHSPSPGEPSLPPTALPASHRRFASEVPDSCCGDDQDDGDASVSLHPRSSASFEVVIPVTIRGLSAVSSTSFIPASFAPFDLAVNPAFPDRTPINPASPSSFHPVMTLPPKASAAHHGATEADPSTTFLSSTVTDTPAILRRRKKVSSPRQKLLSTAPSSKGPLHALGSPSPTRRDPKNPSKSHYFSTGPDTMVGRIPAGVPATSWPATADGPYGLIQERLADNPFQVLLVTIFLTKTTGKKAIPVFYEFIKEFPTPESIAEAPREVMIPYFKNLGLPDRVDRIKNLAASWIDQPPIAGVVSKPPFKYPDPKKSFPKEYFSEPLGVPLRSEFEIAHLKGFRNYGLDSWRIFCRDKLLGRPDQEWRCVVPQDKELRSYVRWRWAMEGKYWREKNDEWIEGIGPHRIRSARVRMDEFDEEKV